MRMVWRLPAGTLKKIRIKKWRMSKEKSQKQEKRRSKSASVSQERVPVTDISMEPLQDFDFVLSNFYTVDSTTSITSDQLNAPN